jgi:hypothetical protein
LISHLLNREGWGSFVLYVITFLQTGDSDIRPDRLFLVFGFYQGIEAVFGEFVQSFAPAAAFFGGFPKIGE